MKIKFCPACPNFGQTRPNADQKSARDSVSPMGASKPKSGRQSSGFTLVETVVATFAAASMLTALYVCFAGGFAMLKMTREDLRATQIALERMEAIRVAPYDYLKDNTKFPVSNTVYFDEAGKSSGKGGTAYTVTFKAEPLSPPKPKVQFYTNMMEITVTVAWKSGNTQCSRSMQTYAAKRGIQGYVSGSY